ncbi:MAG: ATP-dependent metallopeptidase FtsH/Yme1/Tma family protein, partial [Alphaproteobacteria bacterium]|nr:ATP-dependent metallopeptidase FtsH/Yme1/Tma family protein [Alphaproteobacteria bacterium]
MRKKTNPFVIWILIFLGVMLVSNLFFEPTAMKKGEEIPFSALIQKVEAGDVRSVEIQGRAVQGVLKDETSFNSYMPEESGLVPLLKEKGVEVKAVPVPVEGMS